MKANFEGECSEVGMYLCMARIAHREGYPEIGLYWEKGCLTKRLSTQLNLLGMCRMRIWRAKHDSFHQEDNLDFGELTASSVLLQVKLILLLALRKTTLDAIHDTVHEMARDEARHGKALKGLLERYFGLMQSEK